jgi:integrase
MPKKQRLYKRKGSHIWIGVYYENGIRRTRSTKCHNHKAAEDKLAEWERDAANPADAAARKATMTDALELLIRTRTEEAKAGKKSADTVDFYRRKSGHLLRFFEYTKESVDAHGAAVRVATLDEAGQPVRVPFHLNGLRAAHVDDYISMRRSEGAVENTISKELVTLRAALKLARRRDLYREDPAKVLPIAFAPNYKPRDRALTLDELRKLLAQLQPDRAARVAYAVATSANWGETNRALRSHVSAGLDLVHVDGTKRESRKRDVPVVLPICRELLAYALKHAEGRGGKLFLPWGNVRRDLIEACRRAGIPPCSTNDLRRTYSTWHKQAGVSNDTLHPNMGHKDGRMLDRVYGRLTSEQRREAMLRELGMLDPRPVPEAAAASFPEPESESALTDQTTRSTFAADALESTGFGVFFGNSEDSKCPNSLPRGGIEPPTRGFSVPSTLLPRPRKKGLSTLERQRGAAHLQQSDSEEDSVSELAPSRRGGGTK